jgi:hypothetical protein
MTFGRRESKRGRGPCRGYVWGQVGGRRELAALIKALMGREPGVYRRSDCRIEFVYHRERLEGFAI